MLNEKPFKPELMWPNSCVNTWTECLLNTSYIILFIVYFYEIYQWVLRATKSIQTLKWASVTTKKFYALPSIHLKLFILVLTLHWTFKLSLKCCFFWSNFIFSEIAHAVPPHLFTKEDTFSINIVNNVIISSTSLVYFSLKTHWGL